MVTIYTKAPRGLIAVIFIVFFASINAIAQNEVAIGSATTKSNAILYLNGNGSQGLILPVVTGKTAVSNPDKGMIVYDNTDNKVWYRSDNAWVEVGGGSAGGDNSALNLLIQGNQLQLKEGTATLSTVNIASGTQSNGAFMVFNGGSWQYATLSGDVNGANGALQVDGIKGKTIPALPATTQALVYDGTVWKFQALTGGTDSQDLSLNTTTNSLSLTNDATPVDLTPYKQNLTLTGTTLGISGGNTVTLPSSGSGTVTSISAGTGLTTGGSPITTTGTIGIAPGGVDSNELKDGSVTGGKIATNAVSNGNIASNANIDISKLNGGGTSNNNKVLKVVGGVVTYATDEIGATGTGDITEVNTAVGSGLSGGATSGAVNLTLTDTGVKPASYGSDLVVPQIVVDAQGRITDLKNIPIADNSSTNEIQSIATANGFSGTVSGATSIITLSTTEKGILSGNGTAISAAIPGIDYLTPADLASKVTANAPITAGTSTKITYDAKGLVTSGTTLTPGDIPNIAESQVINLVTDLAGKQAQLNGTGFVKANGTTVTYDNSTYLTSYSETDPAVKAISGIVKSNGTTLSAAQPGTDYLAPNGSAALLTGFPILNQNTTGTASTITGTITQGQVTSLTTDLANKVTANTAIAGATNTKITYDAKGLVTSGTTLSASDLPVMTSTVGGAVPTPPNDVTKFLAGDGTWTAPAVGGSGTVTSVSVATANGISGSVATATTTPAITLTLGAITPASVAASGTITGSNLSGTNTGDQINITGNAATVTTNANLTGPVTSLGNTTSIANGAITNAMLATINTAGKVDGGAITTGTIGGSTAINTTGNITGGVITATSFTGNGAGLTNVPLTGTAGGDLAGTYPNPTIGTIAGANIITAVNSATISIDGARVNPSFGTQNISTSGSVNGITLSGSSSPTLAVTGTTSVSGINTGDQINITGNAATVTTNANLTGPVTSVGNATTIAPGVITNAMLANGAVANLSGTNTGDQTITLTGDVTGSGTGSFATTLSTVPVAKGGTGLTVAPASGQILLGNGTGYALSTLTAGSGVNITNGVGTTTISSNGFANPMTTQGDLIVGGAVGTPNRLASPGTSRAILGFDGAIPTWVTGTPSQLLGTDVSGNLTFINQSGFLSSAVPVPIANGGTNAITEAGARTNLGLGALATLSAVNLAGADVTGILPVASGGTGRAAWNGLLLGDGGTLSDISTGTAGQILKVAGTTPSWQDFIVTGTDLATDISITTTGNISITGTLTTAGATIFSALAGSGAQMVVVDNAGLLGKQALPLSGWSLGGNTGTVDGDIGTGTNYIGTKNDAPLNFLVNNQKAGRIDAFNASFGYQSMNSNTSGTDNVAFGKTALTSNSIGFKNNAFGSEALKSNTTGSENVGLGTGALFGNTEGTTNVAVGFAALALNTSGNANIGIGGYSGVTNNSANANTTGSNNTFLGYYSGPGIPGVSNATAIGHQAIVTASNTIQLGNDAVTTVYAGTGTNAKLIAGGLQITGGTLAAGRVLTSDGSGNATWLPAAASGWSLTGNTLAGTERIGSDNAQPLVLETTNVERMRIDATGNVGIGTTSPLNLFHINNTAATSNFMRITNSGAPSGMLIGNSGIGGKEAFISNAENAAMYFQTNSLNRMAIDATGNVGIGTISPTSKLEVAGQVKITGGGTLVDGYVLTSDATGLATWKAIPAGGGTGWGISGNAGLSNANFIGPQAGIPFNIQIGTTKSGKIDPTTLNTYLGYQAGSSTGIRNSALGAEALGLNDSGDENTVMGYGAMSQNKTSDGNTAIGKSALGNMSSLTTAGVFGFNTGIGYHALEMTNSTTTGNGGLNTALGHYAGSVNTTGSLNTFIGAGAGPAATFTNLTRSVAIGYNAKVSASSAMVLGGTGSDAVNVGIGTTTPTATLEVAGTTPSIYVNGTNSGYLWYGTSGLAQGNPTFTTRSPGSKIVLYPQVGPTNVDYAIGTSGSTLWLSLPNTSPTMKFSFWGGTTELMRIQGDGFVGIGTTTPSQKLHVIGNILASGTITPSDLRYKKSIKPLTNALSNVSKLNGVTYYYRTEEFSEQGFNKEKQIGVIAQEIEKIYPELVTTDANGYKAVDYSKLTPILVEAIKELNSQNEQLKSKLKSLESENGVLESKLTSFEIQQQAIQKDVEELKKILGMKASKN